MILIALIAYILISIVITAILCAIIASFNIITDEKEQKTVFYIILIVVFVLSITGINTDGPMPHMFKP